MILLGIETSGLEGSIALSRDETCLGERQLNQTGRRHAQSLVLEIGNLLESHSLAPRDIDLIAVSRGPGSFTGLRVGMVCAKTIAYATGCRFIAIDTFAAIAENLPSSTPHVIVIEDAQRDDLFVGEYRRNTSGEWLQTSPIQIVSVTSFMNRPLESETITGPGVKKLISSSAHVALIFDTNISQPKASAIAELGRRWATSERIDTLTTDSNFWTASPFYLRMSAAEEKHAATVQQPESS